MLFTLLEDALVVTGIIYLIRWIAVERKKPRLERWGGKKRKFKPAHFVIAGIVVFVVLAVLSAASTSSRSKARDLASQSCLLFGQRRKTVGGELSAINQALPLAERSAKLDQTWSPLVAALVTEQDLMAKTSASVGPGASANQDHWTQEMKYQVGAALSDLSEKEVASATRNGKAKCHEALNY